MLYRRFTLRTWDNVFKDGAQLQAATGLKENLLKAKFYSLAALIDSIRLQNKL